MCALPIFAPGGRPGKFFLLLAIFLLIVLVGQTPPARAQQAGQVKAAFLFNFAKFVEWPSGTFANDQAAIILGFPERDPLAEALSSLQGKIVQGRRLEIKRCRIARRLQKMPDFFRQRCRESGAAPDIGSPAKFPGTNSNRRSG